jgi:hypothetical protein
MSLTSILDTFKGFFSRTFWFGVFLPVAIVTGLHLAIASVVFREAVKPLLGSLVGDTPVALPYAFAALVILAYIADPFVTLFGGWLDGSLMPERLHNWLRNRRAAPWQKIIDAYEGLLEARAGISDFRKSAVDELAELRGKGSGYDRRSRAAAKKAVAEVEGEAKTSWLRATKNVLTDGPIDTVKLKAAVSALGSAFKANKVTDELRALHRNVSNLLEKAEAEMKHRFEALVRRYPTIDRSDYQATQLGDIRRQYERYPEDAYGVTFAFLWPRIRATMSDTDQGFVREIVDVSARTNFAILLLALLTSVPLIWLPLCLIERAPIWLFLAIGILTPALLAGTYQLLLQAEIAFGRVTRAAFDRYRLSVLPGLSVALPVDLSSERRLWDRLGKVDLVDAQVDIVFKHAPVSGQ